MNKDFVQSLYFHGQISNTSVSPKLPVMIEMLQRAIWPEGLRS